MKLVDLHLHTSASDGRLDPAGLVELCASRGLSVMAITDHDTVDGIGPALDTARDHPELLIIPGIELSTHFPGGEVHILGYFINYTDSEVVGYLQKMRIDRSQRARKMVEKLNGLGVKLTWQRVLEIAGKSNIGRPHIALALLEAGQIENFKQAFDLYLGYGRPAYVERIKITPEQAVQLIKSWQGLPVMAHPLTAPDYRDVITRLKQAGLEGIEVYYKDFGWPERKELLELARRLDLVATGGSDYHGIDEVLETPPGGAGVPFEAFELLIDRARSLGIKTGPEAAGL